MSAAPEEIRLAARGLQLAALRWNAGAPHRVLATHGWLDNAASFQALAPLLADCELVALDLPGHGRSAHRGAGNLQFFIEYVADVVAALDALGWTETILLGHSLGAGVMSCVAGTIPDRVRALLLIEGFAPQPSPPEKIVDSLRAAVTAALRGPGESSGYPDLAAAIVARRKGYWPLSDAVSGAILQRALTADADGTLRWHTDPRLRQPSAFRLTEEQLAALLREVRAPALLLGAAGGLFPTRDAHAAGLAAMPQLEYRCLPGGHHLHLEPETAPAVAAALRDFLAALPRARARPDLPL
ncbi:MAG: alpha/beta fold hydrolase [Pseudomonadota bacterium]